MEEEAAKLINEDEIKSQAIQRAEQHGIVFLDEIDKVARRSEFSGPDVSREGVQRDLLPLVEGLHGFHQVRDGEDRPYPIHRFGAFHLSKPSDLIPELQGRLPIRVELDALTVQDFVRILTEPDASLTEQYIALMATEGVSMRFAESGIARIAEVAWQVNQRTENIGARRLHTVLERLLETISYSAGSGEVVDVDIDAAYVDGQLGELASDDDIARYIL